METERRIADLQGQIDVLTKALQALSGATLKMMVYEFAFEAMLQQRGTDPEFCGLLRGYVSDFLEENNVSAEVEGPVLGTMNALLEAAGEPPQIPDEG